MTNAQNGARIKAWAGPNVGSGIVKNITFENFFETAVQNPVIIDQVCSVPLFFYLSWTNALNCQCYMTNATVCAQFPSNTFIQDVLFKKWMSSHNKSWTVLTVLPVALPVPEVKLSSRLCRARLMGVAPTLSSRTLAFREIMFFFSKQYNAH